MKLIHCWMVMAFVCLASCSQNTAPANEVQDVTAKKGIAISDIELVGVTDTNKADTAGNVYNGAVNPDWSRQIIKTATIEAECKDYKSYSKQLHAIASQFGGWIASEAEQQFGDKLSNNISIKMPAAQFESMANAINALDAKTISKNIVTQDVTGQVTDAKGRLAVKQAMRNKYLDILKHTGKVEDMLLVESKIDDIHEDIEMTATRLESLSHQASYSTININFYQLLDVAQTNTGNEEPGIVKRMWNAFLEGGQSLLSIFVGLLSIWPVVLLAIGATYYIRKRMIAQPDAKVKTP